MRSHIRRFGAVAFGVIGVAALAQSAHAVVQVTGNVWLSPDASGTTYTVYADDPFTTTVNEGIPVNGNTIDGFRGPTNQITFEGRPVGPLATATTNENFDIIVGRSSSGEMIINQSQLRDQNLIIGDQATINSVLRRGTGVVRIEGFGSLYNNDPTIIPYLGPTQDPDNPTSPSVVPRPDDVGFDLFVGRAGNGVLQLALGGRAEIQDAVIVGDQSGSVGTIVIDGIDSLLQSGGFQTDSNNNDEVNYMIVGRLGSGTMSILNGGQSFNIGPTPETGGGNDSVFGAVIGSNLAAVDTSAPGAGGDGNVYVDGIASKWTIGGNLQIGGFHDNRSGTDPLAPEDLEGNEAIYGSVGRGTLNVSNGALVSIITPPLDDNASNAPDRLDLLVGRFGRVELATGGRIELLGAFDANNPQIPTQEVIRGRLINDGFVGGDGSISVLQFRNRVLGTVQVNADQKLRFEATGSYTEADNVPLPDEEEYPLSNYGVVAVLGTETARAEIEFNRSDTTAPVLTRPFLNLPIPAAEPLAPNGRTEGLIHGEYSTMRFSSGLWNRGVLAFTRGDNVVSGDVVNFGDSAVGADDHGRIVIGPDTNVAFEDDLTILGGTIQVAATGSFQVLAGNSFVTTGTFQTVVTGTSTGMEFNPNLIGGDATFGGVLEVTLTNGGLVPPLSSVSLFDVGGSIFGNFAVVNVIGSTLDFFTAVQGSNLILQSFMAPPAGSGADFNGDGMIDDLDFAIWRQNFGSAGPAGDANGDGIVDAADYTEWRDNCCGPFPGSGSGAGGIGFGGAVPEPASGVMLACGGLLALAVRRRRAT